MSSCGPSTVAEGREEGIHLAFERLRASASEGVCYDCGRRMTPLAGLPPGISGGYCVTHGALSTDGETVRFSAPGAPPDLWTDRG
jgi:NMD protein affecting ribosome stability and mRNA decay